MGVGVAVFGKSGMQWSVDLVVSGLPINDGFESRHQNLIEVGLPMRRVVLNHDVAFGVFLANFYKACVAAFKNSKEVLFVDVEWDGHG